MKIVTLSLAMSLVLTTHTTWAQRVAAKKETPVAVSLFSKGTLSFTNRPNLSYTNFTSQVNGNPKSFDFRIDPSYFFIDGFAVGIDFRTGSNSSKNSKSSYSSWQADLTLTYGRKISGRLNAYIKAFAGPGRSKSEFDISTLGNNPQKLTATYFDVKSLIGFPIALDASSAATFTPYFSYDYYKTDAETNKFTDKTIAFGIKLESYIGKDKMGHGKEGEDFSNTAYKKGAHFIEFNTLAGYSSDKRQQTQVGSNLLIPVQLIKSTNIGLGYQYYVIDNVAVGLNVSFTSTKIGYKATTPSTTKTFMVTPVVTVNAPLAGAGHNLFLQAGYGFGTYKDPKKKLTDLSIKAGYNLFIAKVLTLTPKIGYEQAKGKVPSGVSGIPYTNKGIAAELGVRTWINFWKWK